ncbi:MAG: hypothetical protein IPL98_03875 [Saprospiraceae bacterium]|nr:hypothetical protein [Saprospiraceae bacterium]
MNSFYNKKPIVFCDTMIWYHVSEGTKCLDKSKYQYFGSFSNIADFITSDKKKKYKNGSNSLKKAILAMEREADEIIMVDPISVGSSHWFNILINENEVNINRQIYSKLLQYANGEIKSLEGPIIEGILNAKKDFSSNALNSKKRLDELLKKNKKYSDKDKEEIKVGNILRWLLYEFNKLRGTNFTEDQLSDWSSIEVFVKSYSKFLDNINSKQKPNENSMVDLLQLFYIQVENNTLIWTAEDKVIKKIKASFKETEWSSIIYPENS